MLDFSKLEQIHQQVLQATSTWKEIKESKKQTEVTINLFDLDSRIKNLYDSRLNKIESDIENLTTLVKELLSKSSN